MLLSQTGLLTEQVYAEWIDVPYRERFQLLLSGDLDFRGKDSAYASHNLHAFPAKFPPQLPGKFIEGLTAPGEVVLDPMAGSGTTVVEAFLSGRRGIGVDIDPLALQLCQAKVTPLDLEEIAEVGNGVLRSAQEQLQSREGELRLKVKTRFAASERKFVDYWFSPSTQLELMALIEAIERIQQPKVRKFLELVFSAIIITKSGGVSLARDLAHTRPHRVQDKTIRPALSEYRKRLNKSLESLLALSSGNGIVQVVRGNAQMLPLPDHAVDLIVTSPPYASNAIDYMRAHKFSLVWLGHSLDALSELRREYIGHDAISGSKLLDLPNSASQAIASIAKVDRKKANTLHRYYSEMSRCLAEMARVLKPGRAAVIVVGSSIMRGIDTQTGVCLGEIGTSVGLELIGIATRKLDRDKRMMPARWTSSEDRSQIEERMHEEYVIGFIKPE